MNKYIFEYRNPATGCDDSEILTITADSIHQANSIFAEKTGSDVEVLNVFIHANENSDVAE